MLPEVSRIDAFLRSGRFIRNPVSEFNRYIKKYGDTFRFYMGGVRPSIVTSNPAIIQYVLRKNNRNYDKSRFQSEILSKYVGNGLLTAMGATWRRQRKLIQPGFHKARIARLVRLMEDESARVLAALEREWAGNQPADISKWMAEVTFNVIGKAIFSKDITDDEMLRLSSFITCFQDFAIREARLPFLNGWFRMTGQVEKHVRIAGDVRLIIGNLIDRRKKQDGGEADDLLQMFLDSRYEDDGMPIDREQLIDECLILFVAGHETSANALTWALAVLAENQDAGRKLVSPPAEVRTQNIQAFLNETMRMYPPAWLIDRVALGEDEIEGVPIPAGTVFLLYIYGLHHHPEYWSDPDVFDPSRFMDPSGEDVARNCFFPFGAGPRMCIGNHFAMLEMQVILEEFLSRFRGFTLASPFPAMNPLITLRPKGEVLMKLGK